MTDEKIITKINARLGKNLFAARKKCCITQTELAMLAETSQNMIWIIEVGKGNPTVGLLARLADALGINVSALLENSVAADIVDTGIDPEKK